MLPMRVNHLVCPLNIKRKGETCLHLHISVLWLIEPRGGFFSPFFLKGVQLVILKIKRSRGWDGGGNDCDDVRSAGKGWIKTKCEVDQSIWPYFYILTATDSHFVINTLISIGTLEWVGPTRRMSRLWSLLCLQLWKTSFSTSAKFVYLWSRNFSRLCSICLNSCPFDFIISFLSARRIQFSFKLFS